MSQLENDLKTALAPVEPPAGFADRVVARASLDGKVVPLAARRRRAPLIWAAAAALLVVAGIAAWGVASRAIDRPAGEAAAPPPAAPIVIAPAAPTPNEIAAATPPDLDVGRGTVGPAGGWAKRPRARAQTGPARMDPAAKAEADRATEQLRLALNITSNKLATARRVAQTKIQIPAL